ncbi:hypothetical protein NJ75_04473 [Novosphingobium subterraneum]|uniref:Uncharacterized protein n=2 Tax=Novosphingobium TaxID=165696 RepID=A0A0B8Z679_9SPHN|nr:hypothetical protein NJ75_04473 [Novosphingobium subterraneum]
MAKSAPARTPGMPFHDAVASRAARSRVEPVSVIDISGEHGATRAQRDGWMARDLQMMLAQHYNGEAATKSPPKLGIIALLALASWGLVIAAGFVALSIM